MSTSCLDPSLQIGTLGKMQLSRAKFILCKYLQLRVPFHSLSTASFPSFLLSLCPGPAFPKARLAASMLRPPLPGTPRPCPEEGRLTHRRCSPAAALAWLGTHVGTGSPPPRTCTAARCILTAAAGPKSSPQIPAKEKRALLFRGKTPSSRDTS